MKVLIKADGIDVMVRKFEALEKGIPPAIAKALTQTTKDIYFDEQREMQRVFDRPTPFTLRSLRYRKATPNNLTAHVHHESFGKGTTPEKYLMPQIKGGDRNLKRSESALRHFGILPAGMYTVPGQGAKLDSYGNMSVGQLRQILSYFQSAEMSAGYMANMTEKQKARLAKGNAKKGVRGFTYFAATPNDPSTRHLAPGIYQKVGFGGWGSAIKPILMFVKRPRYQPRYLFYDVAEKTARRRFQTHMKAAMTGQS